MKSPAMDGYPPGASGTDQHFDMPRSDEDKGLVWVKIEGRRCHLYKENVKFLERRYGWKVEWL